VFMMRLPSILMIAGLVVGTVTAGIVRPEPVAAQQIQTPWKLSITAKGPSGRVVQVKDASGEVNQVEAAGQWVGVNLTIRNNSKTRQSAKDVFSLGTAKLVDGKGHVYEVDADASPAVYGDSLDKKPFAPGEARTVRLFFDVPTSARITTLSILGDDVKGEIQEFRLKF
jgi:hypothetical protein